MGPVGGGRRARARHRARVRVHQRVGPAGAAAALDSTPCWMAPVAVLATIGRILVIRSFGIIISPICGGSLGE